MPPKSPHLFYISSWYPHAGSSEGTFIESQLLALGEAGIRAAVLIPGEATLRQAMGAALRGEGVCKYRSHSGVKVVTAPAIHTWPLRWSSHAGALRLRRLVDAASHAFEHYAKAHGTPTALFHHGVFNYTYITAALSARFAVPYWFMEHSGFVSAECLPLAHSWQQPDEVCTFVQRAARRFTVSHHHAELFSRVFGAPFCYCPNVLRASFFAPTVWPEAPFHLVNVAILEPHKDHDTLVRAFAKFSATRPDAVLTIAGEGRLRGELESLVSALGLGARVRLVGHLSPEQVVALLDSAHAFALTSRVETFSVVLAEAMARGLPIVSPHIPGARDRVVQGMGTTFAPGHVEDLARAMEYVHAAATPAMRNRISEMARGLYGSAAFAKCILSE